LKLPDGISVEVTELPLRNAAYREPAGPRKRLVITREWVRPSTALDGMITVLVGGAAAGIFVTAPIGLPIVVGAVLAGVGSVMTYGTARKLFNKTRIVVEDGVLTISNGPLPGPKGTSLPLADVTTFQSIQRGDTWTLVANDDIELLADLGADEAAFIAERLTSELQG